MPAKAVVRVRYEEGVLKPLEEIEANEGEEFEIMFVRKSFKGFHEKAGKQVYRVESDVVEEFLNERR